MESKPITEGEELDIRPLSQETREGVTKETLDDILGEMPEPEPEPEPEQSDGGGNGSGEEKEKTQKEVFAEVKALVYGFNFMIVTGSGLVASMLGRKIDTSNINASDSELTRLAKVAQPVYEKYCTSLSPEATLIIAILSIYGFRVAGEFMGASDLAEKATKEASKVNFESQNEDWKGNPDYFQTGKKAGKRKPKK